MTVFYFVFKRVFRGTLSTVFLFTFPIVAVFMPIGDWFPLPLGFQYYGMILMFIAARLTSILMDDRTHKTLLRISVAPITHFKYLWQNLLAYSLLLVGLSGLVVLTGAKVHGAVVAPGLLFLIYSSFSITAIGFCLAWFSLFRNKEAAFSILAGVITLMAMLGGMMWPIQAVPDVFQRAAMLLPTYWLMEALLITASGSEGTLLLPLAMLILYAVAFVLLGSTRRLI